MEIKEIYSKLHEFTKTATGFEDEKVIFANQVAITRPRKPFITIAASSFRSIATPIEQKLNDAEEVETTVSMVFTASFQAFSDNSHEAEEILSSLYINFSTRIQSEIFQGSITPRKTLKHVSAIPTALSQQIESRAVLEIEMGYLKSISTKVGSIKTVKADGSIDGQEIQIKGKII